MAVVVASCTLDKLFSNESILASDGKVQKKRSRDACHP